VLDSYDVTVAKKEGVQSEKKGAKDALYLESRITME